MCAVCVKFWTQSVINLSYAWFGERWLHFWADHKILILNYNVIEWIIRPSPSLLHFKEQKCNFRDCIANIKWHKTINYSTVYGCVPFSQVLHGWHSQMQVWIRTCVSHKIQPIKWFHLWRVQEATLNSCTNKRIDRFRNFTGVTPYLVKVIPIEREREICGVDIINLLQLL